ncbi:MAG: SufE family protein [Planctomycetales bacterium]|nr:SufE family protein [Planctomycetales bacterium]
MMSASPITLEELLEAFADLEAWDERYGFLVELGHELPPMDGALKNDQTKVDGCMSQVWMIAQAETPSDGPPVIRINADSDSLIVKGLIAVLLALFDGRTPQEILDLDPEQVFDQLGLRQHLSGQRRNGLYAMVQRIKTLAALAA